MILNKRKTTGNNLLLLIILYDVFEGILGLECLRDLLQRVHDLSFHQLMAVAYQFDD